ncbi:hypothetical protein Afil01_04670 [Actinorhabdospora filicis]|uniref:AAA+ ATPase domain-containing protein n=1 Tax=Actinorhabdospora filicis TaxID=1785913 RepID=A0A9W6SGM9_9ACTN|nr:YifB family Mg chelatase-like AAA ATPase [Actinorhabdospora filicis]GLZ75660.1 hypothetical protein Afil01_04670 [Actinorhabdospora filicis]
MGYAKIHAVGLIGLVGHNVTVEAHIDRGQPRVVLSGLPDTVLGQARDRVRSAVVNSGFQWPDQRIAINLLPAALPKHGSSFDIAIALALLVASRQVPVELCEGLVPIGELGLDGQLRPVRGVLPALMAARETSAVTAVVPPENLREASHVEGIRVRGARSLRALVDGLAGGGGDLLEVPPSLDDPLDFEPDIADVVGQDSAKRALEIAAAGGHNMFLVGPPGVGKTMLAERLPPILPRLNDEEARDVTAIHSIAGALRDDEGLVRRAPFQAPHHSASMAALVGGGLGIARPGALSLAHRGVLFLDEVPEFRRDVLDALRQPLECGEISINRSMGVVRYPARVQLLLAANPCPCAAAQAMDCECAPAARSRYLGKLSGPLLDRIDIHLTLEPVSRAALLDEPDGVEHSEAVAGRVLTARRAAAARWDGAGFGAVSNAEVSGTRLSRHPWRLPRAVTGVADWMLDSGRITARGYHRILRIAWSICDLAGRERPDKDDLAEATGLRLGNNL